jgi:hypothetical protein
LKVPISNPKRAKKTHDIFRVVRNGSRLKTLERLDESVKSDNLILMKKTVISVTEAARNFADCVNRAHYQNVTFVLLKNGAPFARLTPDDGKVCTGRVLAEALDKVGLPKNEAKAWRRDLQTARKQLKVPVDKWR